MKQYSYHISVPNEYTVNVKKWTPESNINYSESSGIFQRDKITERIQEVIQNPASLQSEQIIREVGEALFEALFDGQLREDFLEFRKNVIDQKQTLKVVLEINEVAMPEVVAYPWEFMCLPERYNKGDIHFATDPNLSFFRIRFGLEENDKTPIQLAQGEKLKIALVVARPTADTTLSNVEFRTVESNLRKLPKDKIEFLSVINPATPQKVSARLRDGKPDVFHFIGHGQLKDENGKEVGQIAFVNDSGDVDWKKAHFFSMLFQQHRPKIVILQACETGKQSETNAFSSVAYQLMLQGIPVVIAMQYKVSNQTASSFVKYFYEEIIKGNSVYLAVQQARYKIAIDNGYEQRDFAIPVIYMNSSDGYLLPKEKYEFSEGDGSHLLVHVADTVWKEEALGNREHNTFKETGRDSEFITIHDASRNMTIKIPIEGGYLLMTWPEKKWVNIPYRITTKK